MIKTLRITLLAFSLAFAAGFSHGQEELNSLIESADGSACESQDAAACDRLGEAAYERAFDLRRSTEPTPQSEQEVEQALKLAEGAWAIGCELDLVSSCMKLGRLSNDLGKPMLSVRVFNHSCKLGDDGACKIIQNFKDKKQNEKLACMVETERSLGTVPWTIQVTGNEVDAQTPGFFFGLMLADEAQEQKLILSFEDVLIVREDFSGFVFEPDWVNALVQDGDLKLRSINRLSRNSWGLRIDGSDRATRSLLPHFENGQGISFSNEGLSETDKKLHPNSQSGEILYPSLPQALALVRAGYQKVQSEAEQGLCNPDL